MSSQRRSLALHHVRVKLRRTANGLAGVVDDEIEPRKSLEQLPAEGLDAGRVAHVQSEDFEAMPPLAEIRFLRVALGRIAREARGDDQPRARAQQLEARLIADLHASAGQQRDAAAQVRQFGSLVEIELRARRTHLIVEMVDHRELLLADVAMLRIGRFRASCSRSRCSKSGGGKTLGVVNTGLRRSVRIPVSSSTASTRSVRRPSVRARRPSPCAAARRDRDCKPRRSPGGSARGPG